MIHPKNNLNRLTNTKWIQETKSVWYSRPPQRDKLKSQHPATYAESDIIRLIEFFTKPDDLVLDPFVGSGSTLMACEESHRAGTGIELVENWAEIARQRLESVTPNSNQQLINGDSRLELKKLTDNSFDFIVTSPPYWSILRKDKDHKAKKERIEKGLDTHYSDKTDDLGNIESYSDFLEELTSIFADCARVLKNKHYMCVVVSDFRHKSKFYSYHADISEIIENVGLCLEGITILVQDSKSLYPYGIPYAFVSNIHHQYVLVFKKKG